MLAFVGKLARLSDWLAAFGPAGLFAVALLDAAILPLPGGPDAIVLLLSAAQPRMTPVYAVTAAVGSTLGCLVLYYISRRAGGVALKRFSEAKQRQVKMWIDRYDVLGVLVTSVLPPPFPFKVFIVTAGVFRLNVVRFAVAVLIGRIFRFGIEGYLAARYGAQAGELLARYYPVIGLSVAALLIAVVVARNLVKRKEVRGQRSDVSEEKVQDA